MSYDLVIRNGMVVDGSGLPRDRPPVGVKDRKIAPSGQISAPAEEVIDAEGHLAKLWPTGADADTIREQLDAIVLTAG